VNYWAYLMLKVRDVSVAVDSNLVVKNVSLTVGREEIHLLMGPNGAGKSSLLKAIMGLSQYKVVNGKICIDSKEITNMEPYERARLGLALAHQSLPRLRVKSRYLLSKMISLYRKNHSKNEEIVNDLARKFDVEHLLDRELYHGFSGGEAKRFELLTVTVQRPKVCLLDEPDSGVDVDSVRRLASVISELADNGAAILLVTHTGYITRFLRRVDKLHVMMNGELVYSGSPDILPKLLDKGYKIVLQEVDSIG